MKQNASVAPGSSVDPELKSLIRDRIRAMRQQLRDNQAAPENKRRGTRHAFPHTQRIAPHTDSFPAGARFYEVQCQDISTTGFSFRTSRPPGFTELVVELGVSPNCVFVTARIARTSKQEDGSYLIGCQFTGRIEAPYSKPSSDSE